MPNADRLTVCDESSSASTNPHGFTLAKLGTSTAFTGIHAALWIEAAPVCIGLMCIEAALAVTIILTALFARDDLSDRAFRMLPWTTPPKKRRKRRQPAIGRPEGRPIRAAG
jgi:hypothetical protein